MKIYAAVSSTFLSYTTAFGRAIKLSGFGIPTVSWICYGVIYGHSELKLIAYIHVKENLLGNVRGLRSQDIQKEATLHMP